MPPNETLGQGLKIGELCQDDITNTLVFFVNGRKVTVSNPEPQTTLLTYLRNELNLCGTKLGCGEGGCGACTVMVSYLDTLTEKIQHISVNACLAPVCSMHGMAVTTVEGIGSTKTKLHQVQQRIADAHGSQCGFCTPGIVMSMYTLLRNDPNPKMEDIETYFQGNLCRCTGYRPIIEGYSVFAKDGDKCCGKKKDGGCCMTGNGSTDETLESESDFKPYDPTQEAIFPPELRLNSGQFNKQSLVFQGKKMSWLRPVLLDDLLTLKNANPGAKMVVGNTELGIEMTIGKRSYPTMIQSNKVSELTKITVNEEGVCAGASVTWSSLEEFLLKLDQPSYKTRIYHNIVQMLRWFAGKQIRNVGSIGGNIITGSPISDLNPIFMASGCKLTLASKHKKRTVDFDQNFYTGYRKSILEPNEILVSITIPFTRQNEYFVAFKQARRRDDDIAIVNGAFHYTLDEEKKITNAKMAFGGMSFVTKMALNTAEFLRNKPWTQNTFEEAMDVLVKEFPLPPNVPGAMNRYRQTLTISLFFKSYLELSQPSTLDSSELSSTGVFHKEPLRGAQLYEIVPKDQNENDPLRRPLKHRSADKQATGEAVYIDDIPSMKNELHLAFVTSKKAHAKLVDIDATEALTDEGVIAFYCHKDIDPKNNLYQMVIAEDEWVFAEDKVLCYAQVIGVILAKTRELALAAADKVKITYEVLKPIVTIDEAIEAQSFYKTFGPRIKACQNIEEDLDQSDHVISGEIRSGAQEHFYMETNSCLAIPSNEDGELTVYASTQNPTEGQKLIAHALNISMNKVVVKVKRLGGGFGGKETRCTPLIVATAFAASKVNLPVKFSLDRDQDMLMSGHRHPFYTKYRVGFNKDGLIKALDTDIYNNAGYSLDLSFSVMHRAMFHVDNAYNIPKVDVRGFCCKTNVQSNTAFRGFGGPQGLLVTENIMDEIACELNMDPIELREKNLYKTGDRCFYTQKLEHCTLLRCWQECKEQSQFYAQRDKVAKFNSENKWKKRGIAMIPTKFGIAFTAPHLNQAGALVQVYTDGSVLLTHAGTEMGQGLFTKTIQVASKILGIPIEMVHVSETATDKVPNTSPTAASTGTDLNGMAVKKACEEILTRLEPIKQKMPEKSWAEWIDVAYRDRISLSATGYYATPDIGYDHDKNEGNPFNYFTFGVATSLVEIDCLTGDHVVLRTDIVMDLGESINPAIDIGQIEGAFAQGYGLFMLEQMIHSPDGVLLTRGPGSYKLPGFGDMPTEFNVSLLRGAPNPKAVFSSKAVGEPPLFLASSVFFAAKEAIRAARIERGLSKKFNMNAPATGERIRMACEDHITNKADQLPPEGTYKPWGIQL